MNTIGIFLGANILNNIVGFKCVADEIPSPPNSCAFTQEIGSNKCDMEFKCEVTSSVQDVQHTVIWYLQTDEISSETLTPSTTSSSYSASSITVNFFNKPVSIIY